MNNLAQVKHMHVHVCKLSRVDNRAVVPAMIESTFMNPDDQLDRLLREADALRNPELHSASSTPNMVHGAPDPTTGTLVTYTPGHTITSNLHHRGNLYEAIKLQDT